MDSQLSLFDSFDWKNNVRSMLDDVIRERELPTGSLYLSDNYGQSGKNEGKLISHSVCIWEPDYPPMPNEKRGENKIVVTLFLSNAKSRPDDLDVRVRVIQEADLHEYLPEDAEMIPQTASEEETGAIRIRFSNSSPNLVDYIRKNTEYCIDGYESKATRFGCCSRFIECSDAKKCVHTNKLYSKACIYRDSLDEGRIFYGKNKNIGR